MNLHLEPIVSDLAHVLLLVALLSYLGSKVFDGWLGPQRGALAGFSIGAFLSILPEPVDPAFYTRAIIGDPGALGWVFLIALLLKSVWRKDWLSQRESRLLALVAFAGAVSIYPGSLGVPGAPDFYNSNLGGSLLPSVTLGFALFAIWRGFFISAAAAGSGLALYGLDLHESANLWDCLIDFPSVLVSLVILVRWASPFRRLRKARDAASLPTPPRSP